MFEITKDQLGQVSDVNLRELVARLCEAELQNKGLPVSAVRWGGSHTAPDGGLDIDCRIEQEDVSGDFVPRRFTGFQVKKSSMPPARVVEEMSPGGTLRPIFADLAIANGCYIIVSLGDDPTGEPLRKRLQAMQAELAPVQHLGDLRSGFYGRAELCNWLRQYPAVQLWVREILGIQLQGWRPFGRWTLTAPDDDDELICRPGISVVLPGRETEPLDIERGIAGIRDLVRTSSKAVRIVGLSGVGKSRIVQALFEDSVGEDPLDRSLAVYADIGTEPDPSARQVLERLTIEARPAILVLDNCPTETHNLLAAQASTASHIRLITVEYDIREDRAEVTTVVRINSQGPEIADALILRRHPALGQVNSRVIAEFSGGNSRLALALADAVDDQESLSDFSNAQLFERLFFQRGARDDQLLAAAEALSLVYSYSLESDEGGVDELATLADLVGLARPTLYRATQTLVDRQLVQKRARWRAVLPPAVSNSLAARALRNIPFEQIRIAFEPLPDPRMLRSFGRRLGYLHDHDIAQNIVRAWMSPGGRLHDVDSLDDDDIQLLANVAPVAPDAVLQAVETRSTQMDSEYFYGDQNPRAPEIAALLSAIAYDAPLFTRTVAPLARFATAEFRVHQVQGDTCKRLFRLFSMCLSGTEAGPDARERVVRQYLFSEEEDEQHLGLGMLEAALESGRWMSFGNFEFGARPRSFGYRPRTFEEQNSWFQRFLALAHEVATGENDELSGLARAIFANNFRGLWRHIALRLELTAIAKSLNEHGRWFGGWQAVRSIKHHDYRRKKLPDDAHGMDLLNELDELLKPEDLVSQVRIYVLTPAHIQIGFDDESDVNDQGRFSASRERAAARAFALGEAVAGDLDIINELSEDLLRSTGGYVVEFGRGIASSCSDPHALWLDVAAHLEREGDATRLCQLLQGILEAIHERDPSLAEQILDLAVQSEGLRNFFVCLQFSVPLNRRAVQRLLDCLNFDDTPAFQFGQIAWQHPSNGLDDADIARVLLRVLDRPDGPQIVLDGLNMRAPEPLPESGFTLGEDLSRLGLLATTRFLRGYKRAGGASTDYSMRRILACCMIDGTASQDIDDLTEAFFAAVKANYGYIGDLEETAEVLISKVPIIFLDRIFLGADLDVSHHYGLFAERHEHGNLLSELHPSKLLDWCRKGEFNERLALISEAIYPFAKEAQNGDMVFSEQAHAILDASPEAEQTLNHFTNSVRPSGWSGSLADIIARRCRPFELLLAHERADIHSSAERLVPLIKDAEAREREREKAEDQERDQRFE